MNKIRILLIAADPKNDTQSAHFYNAIWDGLRMAQRSDYFDVRARFASKIADFTTEIEEFNPHILQLVGHGNNLEQFVFEDIEGNGVPIKTKNLSKIIGYYKDNLYCVNIAACFSDELATNVISDISYAISYDGYLDVEAAKAYTKQFFYLLAVGNTAPLAGKKAYDFLKAERKYITIPTLKEKPNLEIHKTVFELLGESDILNSHIKNGISKSDVIISVQNNNGQINTATGNSVMNITQNNSSGIKKK